MKDSWILYMNMYNTLEEQELIALSEHRITRGAGTDILVGAPDY
jgi:hypothetical protein